MLGGIRHETYIIPKFDEAGVKIEAVNPTVVQGSFGLTLALLDLHYSYLAYQSCDRGAQATAIRSNAGKEESAVLVDWHEVFGSLADRVHGVIQGNP